jgi:hypothetical protein
MLNRDCEGETPSGDFEAFSSPLSNRYLRAYLA